MIKVAFSHRKIRERQYAAAIWRKRHQASHKLLDFEEQAGTLHDDTAILREALGGQTTEDE